MTDQHGLPTAPTPSRWAIGGDLAADPFRATLDFWDGNTPLVSVPLPPAVLRDMQAGLTGVHVAQRRAMGLSDVEESDDALVVDAAGVEPGGRLGTLTHGWRFVVVCVSGAMMLASVVLASLPSVTH